MPTAFRKEQLLLVSCDSSRKLIKVQTLRLRHSLSETVTVRALAGDVVSKEKSA